jgi:hypothetical protein
LNKFPIALCVMNSLMDQRARVTYKLNSPVYLHAIQVLTTKKIFDSES